MNIILSIKPKWAEKIYSGEKTIEWRKNCPKVDVSRVFLYETAPVCKITGFFFLNGIFGANSKSIDLDKYRWEDGCVPLEDLQKYQGKNNFIFGWIAGKAVKIQTPKILGDFGLKRPPQSWCYTRT